MSSATVNNPPALFAEITEARKSDRSLVELISAYAENENELFRVLFETPGYSPKLLTALQRAYPDGLFHLLSPNAGEKFREYCREKYRYLDGVFPDLAIGIVAGLAKVQESTRVTKAGARVSEIYVPNSRKIFAKKMIELSVFDWNLPDNYPQNKNSHASFYYNPEVIGSKDGAHIIVELNVRKFLLTQFKSLDQINKTTVTTSIYTMLGLTKPEDRTLQKAARRFIELQVFPREIPASYAILQNRGSYYFDREVVGEEASNANLATWIRSNISNLDQVSENKHFGPILGITRQTHAVARELVRRRILSAEIPSNHPLSYATGKLSLYLIPEVVECIPENQDLFRRNVHKALSERYQKAADVYSDATLATFARLLKTKRCVTELVAYMKRHDLFVI